jgi:hypothetical protein
MLRSPEKLLVFVIVILLLISACGQEESHPSPTFSHSIGTPELTFASQPSTPDASPTQIQEPLREAIIVVTVTYDEKEIRQQQEAADQGHFPLRISDPAYTAMDYLSVHYPDFGEVKKPPQYLQKNNTMAVVEIQSRGKVYIVTLEKLARRDDTGVWFVTRVEIRSP